VVVVAVMGCCRTELWKGLVVAGRESWFLTFRGPGFSWLKCPCRCRLSEFLSPQTSGKCQTWRRDLEWIGVESGLRLALSNSSKPAAEVAVLRSQWAASHHASSMDWWSSSEQFASAAGCTLARATFAFLAPCSPSACVCQPCPKEAKLRFGRLIRFLSPATEL
jgi:hypothetical protein